MLLDFKLISNETNLESNCIFIKTLLANVRYQLLDLIGH